MKNPYDTSDSFYPYQSGLQKAKMQAWDEGRDAERERVLSLLRTFDAVAFPGVETLRREIQSG